MRGEDDHDNDDGEEEGGESDVMLRAEAVVMKHQKDGGVEILERGMKREVMFWPGKKKWSLGLRAVGSVVADEGKRGEDKKEEGVKGGFGRSSVAV